MSFTNILYVCMCIYVHTLLLHCNFMLHACVCVGTCVYVYRNNACTFVCVCVHKCGCAYVCVGVYVYARVYFCVCVVCVGGWVSNLVMCDNDFTTLSIIMMILA